MNKILNFKFLIAACLLLISTHGYTDTISIHEVKINRMIELGVISPESAKKQLSNLETHKKRQDEFSLQTRGVASTIKNFKIYQIENEPIEIPSN
jgi:hypothetical protein